VNSPIPGGAAACFAGPGGRPLFSAKGYPLANAPDISYTLAANYHHDFAGSYALDFNLNWNWRSSEYTVVADPNTIVPAYGLLGATLGFGPADKRWRVAVFGRNLLDQYFVSGIFPSFFDDGTNTGDAHPVRGYSSIPNPEAYRTVGVRLDVRFGQ
jgi:iron complex outermembrane receptor protein